MPKVCLKYFQKMWYARWVSEKCLRYFYMLYLCPIYRQDKAEICLIYSCDMWYAWEKCEKFLKYSMISLESDKMTTLNQMRA